MEKALAGGLGEGVDPERDLKDLLEVIDGGRLVLPRVVSIRERRKPLVQRRGQPASVDSDDYDEQLKRQQQVDRLQDVDDAVRWATIEVVYVEDDPVRRALGIVLWCRVVLAGEVGKVFEVAAHHRDLGQQAPVVRAF